MSAKRCARRTKASSRPWYGRYGRWWASPLIGVPARWWRCTSAGGSPRSRARSPGTSRRRGNSRSPRRVLAGQDKAGVQEPGTLELRCTVAQLAIGRIALPVVVRVGGGVELRQMATGAGLRGACEACRRRGNWRMTPAGACRSKGRACGAAWPRSIRPKSDSPHRSWGSPQPGGRDSKSARRSSDGRRRRRGPARPIGRPGGTGCTAARRAYRSAETADGDGPPWPASKPRGYDSASQPVGYPAEA